MIDQHGDWWLRARRCSSPNSDPRPDPNGISLVVVHCIALPPGEYGSGDVADLFLNRLDCRKRPEYRDLNGVKVSAHVLIRRDGSAIQFVPFRRRAWHAGRSAYQGRENCNDFSIGIELEGTDCKPFTLTQYRWLATLCRGLRRHYGAISPAGIVGHSDIAPGRKTDPGSGFNWPVLRKMAGVSP